VHAVKSATEEAVGHRETSDLVQRRASCECIIERCPSSLSQLSETAPRIRGSGEASGQSEALDLVKRIASREAVESALLKGA